MTSLLTRSRPPRPASDPAPARPVRRPRGGGTYWLFLVPGMTLFMLIIGGPLLIAYPVAD